jgi:hypothetical protein
MMLQKPTTRVTVIVLNWNGLRFLGPCITSLMRQKFCEYELILIDNGSDDGSVDYVKKNFHSVRVVENAKNLGFAEGNNVGLRVAIGQHVIVLNNDTRVPPDFIETLVNSASRDSKIASVGCRIVQEDGSMKYGPLVTNNGFLVPLFMGSVSFPDRIARLFGGEGDCATNCAAAALYRRHVLEEVGGFDPDFWSDWEDHDLGFRLWVAGYKNFYTTRTQVLHVGGGSFGRELSKDRYVRIIRNMLFTYVKNYESRNLATRFLLLFWIILPLRHVLLMIVYELTRLSSRSYKTGLVSRRAYLALPEAYFSFLRDLRAVMRKRAVVQAKRKVPDSAIFSATQKGWVV